MGLINRDKDASEQKEVFNVSFGAQATGLTLLVLNVPYPCTVKDVKVSALGLSGAPTVAFKTSRFIVGVGNTTLTGIAGTWTAVELGTSGPVSASVQVTGQSLLDLLPGDIINIQTGGTNSAAAALNIEIVLKKTQDILQIQGSST